MKKKFSHIVSESLPQSLSRYTEKENISRYWLASEETEVTELTEGVVFAFTDGSTRTADLLFGADGIHFSVQKYIAAPGASRKAALQFSTGIDPFWFLSTGKTAPSS